MKYNKIITITLTNAFILLVFASLLSSCQKSNIKTTGLYTTFNNSGRTPASAESKLNFDPKQIYIYCKINSVNNKQCYKQYYNEHLELAKNKISREELSVLLNNNDYEKIQGQVNTITASIVTSLNQKIDFYTDKRKEFCKVNSKYHLKKCLNGNLTSDTMNILNSYQQKVNKINGQEYLYLKNIIKAQFENKIEKIRNNLENDLI